MKSYELAKILLDQPDKEISVFWDGGARGEVEGVVNSERDGIVIVGEWSIYRDGDCRAYDEHEIIHG